MGAPVGTVALLVVLLILAASASPVFLSLWARAMTHERELEMWQMMRRRGLVDDAARPADMARAIRRCNLCPSVDECRAWLASGRADGVEDFCPNARFFDSLERARHR